LGELPCRFEGPAVVNGTNLIDQDVRGLFQAGLASGRWKVETGFAVSGVPQGLDDRMTCPATGRLDASCQESSGLWVFERWRFLTSERTRTSS